MTLSPDVKRRLETAMRDMIACYGIEACRQLTPAICFESIIESGQTPERKPLADEVAANREEVERIIAGFLGYC